MQNCPLRLLRFEPATFCIVVCHSGTYTNFCQPVGGEAVVRGARNSDLLDDFTAYVFVFLSPDH